MLISDSISTINIILIGTRYLYMVIFFNPSGRVIIRLKVSIGAYFEINNFVSYSVNSKPYIDLFGLFLQ